MPAQTADDTELTLAEEVMERLDLMLAVLQLAHHDAITRAAIELRANEVNAAILDVCADDWIPAAELKAKVRAKVAVGDTTLKARLATLVARRAIQRRGATHTTAYRALGLV
jgi:ubiquinone/menaquinone biosynthesis C-methylase UbiE